MAFEVQGFEERRQAGRVFTDREEPRKAFWDKVEQYKSNMDAGKKNAISVLTYYGIGGVGKSTLVHKLQEEIDEHNAQVSKKAAIPYVYYDMRTDTGKRGILERLEKLLNKKYGFTFPVFQLALNVFRLKTGNGIEIEKHEGILQSNEYVGVATDIATAGIDMLNTIPLAGPIAAGTLKIIDKLVANQRNKSEHRKIELSNLQQNSPEEILTNLQLNFARDLTDNMRNAASPLVVFLDTYELLVNELTNIGAPLMNDSWLRDLHNGLVTHVPNVIWVIAGRERIKWDQIIPEWAENVEQHLIGDLSDIDTKDFLTHSGISDEQIQKEIFEISKGIPVYLDICVKNYFYLADNQIKITKKGLGEDQEELLNRLMIYTDTLQKDLLYILSCLDSWTEEYLYEIAAKMHYPISATAIKTIEGLSFIESMDGFRFRMHQLVKEVLFHKCQKDIKKKVLGFNKSYLKDMLDHADPSSGEFIGYLKEYLSTGMKAMSEKEEIEALYQEVKEPYIKQLKASFQYQEVCTVLETILQYVIANHHQSPVVAEIYMHYALCLSDAGMYDNMALYAEKANSMVGEYYDDNSDQRADSLFNLADVYFDLGRYQEAIKLLEKAFMLRKNHLGEEHPITALTMNNLSLCYRKAERYKEALEMSEKVLELWKRTLGEEHPHTITAMNNLSVNYSDAGKNNKALEVSEKVLELWKQTLGEEHPQTITVMSNLSYYYRNAGRNEEALEISEKVLALRRRILGDEHPGTITAMNNLSAIYHATGRNDEAMGISERVLSLRQRILGEEHPDTIAAMQELSESFGDAGRKTEAMEISEKVLELQKRILGEEHPDTINEMYTLSRRYIDAGKNKEAIEISQKALELRKRLHGEEHPDTILAMKVIQLLQGDIDTSAF